MVYKTKVSWDATYDVIVIGFGVLSFLNRLNMVAVCFSFPYGGIIPRCDIIWVIYADFEPHFLLFFGR